MDTNIRNSAESINDEIDFDDSKFTADELQDHVQNISASVTIPPDEVLDKLLEHIEPVNFEDDDDRKISNAEYRIKVIDTLLQIADNRSWNLCKNLDFIYCFNGCYWSLLDKEELTTFLSKVADAMGVHRNKASDYKFADELYKQFLFKAHFKAPKRAGKVLIALSNGTFEISSNGKRELRGFDPNDFLTSKLPFPYDPKATAPTFEKYLSQVLPKDERQLVLAEYIGYLFTDLKLEKALLLYGSGANGKSVFFEILTALLGQLNISNYSLHSLTDSSGYYRAMLSNKLVNYASEINGNLEASIFKQLVSGEPVEARLPYGQPMIIRNYGKLIFNTNGLPQDVEYSNAFFRRFLIIPFDVTIRKEDQDIELAKKIIGSELPGVFNWVLSGLDRILKNKKFTECQSINNQLDDFRKTSDTVALFIEEADYTKSVSYSIPLAEVYRNYKKYCEDNGFRAGSTRTLSQRIKSLGYETHKTNSGLQIYFK